MKGIKNKGLAVPEGERQAAVEGGRVPRYKPLDRDDLLQIDRASMEVLSEAGFEVYEPEAFAFFKKVAKTIDEGKRLIKVEENTVRELLSLVPSTVTLYGREEKHDCVLGSGEVYFGTGGTALNILDYGQKESRPATLKDLERVIRVVDRMEHLDICLLPTYPHDLSVEEVDIHRFRAGLTYTDKHVMGGVYTAGGIDEVIGLAEDIAGSEAALRRRPFISFITCGLSPLRLDKKYGSFLIKIAREGLPLAVPVEPLCGGTAPMSLAGTLVVQNCDSLIHIMLAQLINPGTPVIYGCVASVMDMRTMRYLGAPVESGLINAAAAQLARYYGLPYYGTAGISDSKTLDAQCGYEAALTNMLVGLSGADFIHDAAGLMEFACTVSLEKLIIDNEIIGMVKRAIKGINVSAESLCLEEIIAAGPGGNFITGRHTRKFLRTEHYQPGLSDRHQRPLWLAEGATTASRRAHEIVKAILGEQEKSYLPAGVKCGKE